MKLFSKNLNNNPYPLTLHKHLYLRNDHRAKVRNGKNIVKFYFVTKGGIFCALFECSIIYHKICSDVGTRRFLFIKHSIKSQIPKTQEIVFCFVFADHRKREKKRIRMSGPQCCSNPPTLNPNAGAGHVEQLGGLSTYVSGSPNSKLAILLISDVYGTHTFL